MAYGRRVVPSIIGMARGCRADKKTLQAYFTGKSCKCTPRQSKSQIFRIVFFAGWGRFGRVGVVNLVLLACVLTATTKKVVNIFEKVVNFFEEESAPQRKFRLRLCLPSMLKTITCK